MSGSRSSSADPGSRHIPGLRRLTVREWVRLRRADLKRSAAARRALCDHDGGSPPCPVCWVRYW